MTGMKSTNKPKDGPLAREAVVKPGTANPGTGNLKPKAPRKTGGGELLKTREELAQATGWSKRTIDRLVAAKVIPVIRVGRTLRFRLDAVMAALEKNSTVKEAA